MPNGAKESRFPEENALMAAAMNSTSTAILMPPVMVVTKADSLAPRTSSRQHRPTRTAADALTTPPSPGGALSAAGRDIPHVERSGSLRTSPHPTATAEEAAPYSSSRHAPTR